LVIGAWEKVKGSGYKVKGKRLKVKGEKKIVIGYQLIVIRSNEIRFAVTIVNFTPVPSTRDRGQVG